MGIGKLPAQPQPTKVTGAGAPAPAAPAAPAPPAAEGKAAGWAAKGAASRPATPAGTAAPANMAYTKLLDAEVGKLQQAMKGLGTDEKAIFNVLEKNPPPVLAAIAQKFEAATGVPLRRALNDELSDVDARRALKALDASLVKQGDTQGLGANVDKLLAMRKIGQVSESDLVQHYQPTTNNKIDLLINGDKAFPKLFEAIDGAKDTINVSYYILDNDKLGNEFADKLIAAKQRGVEVRLSLDGIGTQLINPFSNQGKLVDRLEKAGIEVHRNVPFDPTRKEMMNHPDHRKIVVVDGKIGFTGGMNVGSHYIDPYHDVMVRMEGDSVKQMQSEWMGQWMHMGGKFPEDDATFRTRYFPELKTPPGNQTIKVAQHIPGENREILKNYLAQIGKAEKSIHIENPYCTNPDIQTALIAAAKRGVEVHVVLPGESDHGFSHLAAKQRYPEMINAGVKIYEYPGFNHDKVMVVDEKFTTVGSSNLDDVALYHVYEMNMEVENEDFAKSTIKDLFHVDIPKSKPMRAEDITKLQILTGKFWNLFSHII